LILRADKQGDFLMPYKQILMILVLMLTSFTVLAQPPEAGGDDAALLDPYSNPPSGIKEEKSPELEGDTIVFKSGSELKGIHIIRESALFVEVEYLPGEPPVKFPTSQIKEIIRQDPASHASGNAGASGSKPDLMPGEEVSAQFHQALMTVLSETPLELTNADYLAVIKDFAEKAEAPLEIKERVTAIPEQERVFTRTLPAGITLLDFVQKEFSEIAPKVRAVLQFDKLILELREAPVE